jgi:hypothetical protein
VDKIIEGYIKDFRIDFGLEEEPNDRLFEHFVNYCGVATEVAGPLDLPELRVGGGQDLGLDGIAVIVNDHLLTSADQLEDLRGLRGRLEITFVFTQAKSGTHFDAAEIGNFLFGVREFFNPNRKTPVNDDVKWHMELAEALFAKSIDFRRNPDCLMYYATTGSWTDDRHLLARIETETALLRKTNLFSTVDFRPLDAAKLKALYKNHKRHVVQDVEFERHAILPRLDRVSVAYIGILPIREYLKLIKGPDGRLNKSVFYENIRDFQGDTPVNNEIRDTLTAQDSQAFLPILNNGITIVARTVEPTGTRFRLTDYQIVNGCQTSHAIYNSGTSLNEDVCIPVKIIGTTDQEITTRIIRATNRQTEIKPEAFIALSAFHKELEDLYASMARESDHPLYYERRSRQYDGSSVRPHQIVTLAGQVANFTAVFLEEPHSCHRYYGELLSAYRGRLFGDDHPVFPYYVSSFLLYRLEGLFRTNAIPSYLRPFRFHLALLTRRAIGGVDVPPPGSGKRVDTYCRQLLESLKDNRRAVQSFQSSAETLKRSLSHHSSEFRALSRIRSFTEDLLSATDGG